MLRMEGIEGKDHVRQQTLQLAYAILDAMRANREQALAGAYDLGALTCAVPATAGTLAQNDLIAWMQSLQATLGPDACGQVSCPANSPCTVTVRWNDVRAADGAVTGAAAGNKTVTTVTLL